jgi:hypothetical protein
MEMAAHFSGMMFFELEKKEVGRLIKPGKELFV